MKKILYWFKKIWLIIKKGFLVRSAMLDDTFMYDLWVCVERPDGSTFSQCVEENIGEIPPKGIVKEILEKNYFGKGYKVCNVWLQQKMK